MTVKTTQPSVSDQAAAWLAALSDEACTPEERRNFAHWLTSANTHVDEFLRISALTRRLQRQVSWPEIDLDQLITEARAQTKIAPLTTQFSTPAADVSNLLHAREETRARSVRRRPLLVAAAAIAVVAVAVAAVATFAPRHLPKWTHNTQRFETGLGELRSVTLEDGSIVELNAKSSIRMHFTPAERKVQLVSGEAIFRVAHNASRPFKVSTALAEITAIGTQFNVDSRSSQTIVTVIEGQVRVASDSVTKLDQLPLLNVGDQAVVQSSHSIKQTRRVDPKRVVGWTARRLYFDDTPVSEAIPEFQRFSERQIEIEDPALAQRHITGTFDAGDPGALVQFLQRFGGTTVINVGNGWIVRDATNGKMPQ